LRDEYTRAIAPARARAAETLKLERTLSYLVNEAYALTPAEIDFMWRTAPLHMPLLPPTIWFPSTESRQDAASRTKVAKPASILTLPIGLEPERSVAGPSPWGR
jgi:hypothetical protein